MEDRLSTEGKKFYTNHFGKFSFIEYIVVQILDMVKERFRSVGLGVLLSLIYISSVSSQILGSFDVRAIWAKFRHYEAVSEWLKLDG